MTPTCQQAGSADAAAMLIVGVDAGGTSTRAVLVNITGHNVTVVVRAGAGPANVRTVGEAASRHAFEWVLGHLAKAAAGEQVAAGIIGVAGSPSSGPARAVWEELFPGVPVRIDNDLLAAFTSGTVQQDGAIVVAGTGSMAAQVVGGQLGQTSGGWGWFLGDDGGAVWVGREVARAVLADIDGLGPSTALTAALADHLHIEGHLSKRDISVAVYTADNAATAVAEFARLATSLADDPVSSAILDEAAASLYTAVAALPPFDGPVVVSGSVANSAPIATRLRAAFSDVCFVADGLAGAVVLAARSTGLVVDADLHATITSAVAVL